MKSNAKSSITLPPAEVRLVQSLKVRLKLKSNVEVVRRGIRLLQETTERRALRDAYRAASRATRGSIAREIQEFDSEYSSASSFSLNLTSVSTRPR